MNKKTRKLFTWCLVVALVVTQMLFANVAFAATNLKGTDRYQTALEVVKAGWTTSDNAVIARGDDLADALAAAPLAYAKGKAPILLTETNALPTGVMEELTALGVKNVYIVGGLTAVSQSVEDALAAKFTVKRVSGASRYLTSLAVAEEAFPTAPAKAVIVNGTSVADALSVSSIAAYNGMPILLVAKDSMEANVATYLTGKEVYAVGGTGVISDANAGNATRLAGADRFATNVAVLKAFTLDYSKVFVAKGTNANAVDALGGAAYAAKGNNPMFLVDTALTTAASDLLKANVTGSTEVVTLGGLVPASVASAIEALQPSVLKVNSVTAVGAKKLAVKFSKAVDDTKAAFTVKKGSISFNIDSVEWNDAKTEATLTLVSKLTEGDYTVTATGLGIEAGNDVGTVTAENEKIANIEITSDVAPLLASSTNVTFNFGVYNQYDEDITSTASLTWTPSTGTFAADPETGVKQLNGTFVKDQIFTVTAFDPTTGTSVYKSLKVADVAKVSEISILGLYNEDNKTLYTDSTFTDFYLKVSAVDQYGNAVGTAALNDAAQTTVVIPTTNVIDKVNFVTIPGTTDIGLKLAKPASNVDGTVTVRLIANLTGKSAAYAVTVEKASALDSLVLEKPADLVVKGETVKIPFAAYDQNGVELSEAAKDAIANSTVTCTDPAVTFSFDYNYQTKKTELTMDATAGGVTPGNKLVMAVTPTGKTSQFSVEIKDTAEPVAVSATTDLVGLMTVGGVSTVDADNFVVVDQYDRQMDLDATWFTSYELDLASGTPGNVTVGAAITVDATTGGAGSSVDLTGIAVGDSDITVSIHAAGGGALIAGSQYEFTASTVDKADIDSYVAETADKLYDDQAATTHNEALDVYGLTANGSKVALNATDISVTASDSAVTYGSGVLDVNTLPALGTTTDDTTEANVTLLIVIQGADGPVSLVKTVTVTDVAPEVAEIAVDSTANVTVKDDTAYVTATNASIANLLAAFNGVDQYGIAKTLTVTNVLVDSVVDDDTASLFSVTNNGQASPTLSNVAADDTFKITVFADGLTKSLNVVVTP